MKFKLREVTKKEVKVCQEMFDLTVENNHSYCVENIIVHNCGYPQLSAIDECAHAAHGLKSQDKHHGLVCGDGGCRLPADVVKGFAVGADFMMLGGMFAGAYECEGEWQYDEYDAKVSLLFYGMSSKKAQNKHGSGLQDYRSSEGRVMEVPYKGPVREILKDIEGGLRSGCTYTGATSLKDLPKTAKFVRVNKIHYDRSI